jgi:UDPglucose 6-dehydrogenase
MVEISVIGSGYVGIVTGLGFAELGNRVIFVDIDDKKLDAINNSKPPIFEPHLEDLMERNRGRYYATESYDEAILNSQITFICVGTPSNSNGSINLDYIKSAAKNIGKVLKEKDKFHVVVVKSTVVPGTTEEVIKPILEQESDKKAFHDFGLAVNPEFLREGNAVEDFFKPDRIVVGTEDDRSKKIMNGLYSFFDCPKLFVNLKTAEMIKYASNAFLATKISFANEIGNICKKLGVDTYEVFQGVGLDHRINPSFFKAGIGFGGSCFPKDIRALISKAEELGEETRILKSVMKLNEEQPLKLIQILKKYMSDLKDRTIGILGLAFKPDTDDVRESRAIPVIRTLIKEGAKVIAYDPVANENFRKIFPDIVYVSNPEEVLNSEAILILTEWEEFERLDYSGKMVIDGRRIEKARKEAKIYEGVCW